MLVAVALNVKLKVLDLHASWLRVALLFMRITIGTFWLLFFTMVTGVTLATRTSKSVGDVQLRPATGGGVVVLSR